jgi:hypothetical protein
VDSNITFIKVQIQDSRGSASICNWPFRTAFALCTMFRKPFWSCGTSFSLICYKIFSRWVAVISKILCSMNIVCIYHVIAILIKNNPTKIKCYILFKCKFFWLVACTFCVHCLFTALFHKELIFVIPCIGFQKK